MSAQGATLGGRGTTLHLPIWPVAVLVAAIAAVTIGVTMIGESSRDATRPFRLTGEAANSTTAIREGGVVVPVTIGISHVTPKTALPAGYVGLDNSGAYLPRSAYPNGLENPTAYVPSEGAPAVAAPATGGIMVNGEICGQCR